jgi:Glycosyl transferase family 2
MSFRIAHGPNWFRVNFPTTTWPPESVAGTLAKLHSGVQVKLEAGDSGLSSIELRGAKPYEINNVFAHLNGYPEHPPGVLERFRNSESPLVSCILLLPFNELFARNAILPAIIRHSHPHPIEIIVVLAGFGVNRRPITHLKLLDSELTSIAKGYNLGVRKARGEYIALFHDDCFIEDPQWIDQALQRLADGATAVTPEFDQWRTVPVAKAVPLIMRRRDYERLGGYDEYYFAGVEDMDLTVSILAGGGEVHRVGIGYRHLRGMGTSLILHEEPHQLKMLYGYQVLPAQVIERVHETMMQRLLENGWIRMLEGDYHLHFLQKHGAYIASQFKADLALLTHAYEIMRYRYLLTPAMAYLSNRAKLVEAYRALMNIAELQRPVDGEEAAE